MDLVLEDVLVLDDHQNTLLYAPSIRVDIDHFDPAEKRLDLGKVTIDGAFFALMKYKNEHQLNLQFIIDYFQSTDTTGPKSPAVRTITLKSLYVYDTRFIYDDQNARHYRAGMDYGYIDVREVNLMLDALCVTDDLVRGHIHSLSAKEKNGFELKHFSAEVAVGPKATLARNVRIITPASDLKLDLRFSYQRWDDYNHFIEKVHMKSHIRESRLNINDIGFFAPELAGVNENVRLTGDVEGRVGSLTGDHLDLRYGQGTKFAGNARITGLPDIAKSWFRADIHQLTTQYSDVASFGIPDGQGGYMIPEIPGELQRLGKIRLSGICSGYINNLLVNMELESDLGKASAEVSLTGPEGQGIQNYSGHLITGDFDIGTMLDQSDLVGKVSLDADIQGSGFTGETATVRMQGAIHSFGFKDYLYQNIMVDGNLSSKVFNGSLEIDDPNLRMAFDGSVDFSDSIPVYDFSSYIALARLNRLNLIRSDSITDVSCRVNAHFQGNTLDNLFGGISITDASYLDGTQRFSLSNFKLTALKGFLNYRTFIIKSDYVDATFKGNFYFNDLILSAKKFITAYLPGVSFSGDSLNQSIKRQNFAFDITFYNATPVLKYFVDDISVSPNTELTGTFDSEKNSLILDFNSGELTYGSVRFMEIHSQAASGGHNIHFTTDCSKILLTDSASMDNIRLNSDINNDSITFSVNWDNLRKPHTNAAEINGYLTFTEGKNTFIGFGPSWLTLTDTTWNFYSGGDIKIDSLGINVPGIYALSKDQQFEFKGRISKNPMDKLRVRFLNFNLSDFDNVTQGLNFDLDGHVNGYVDVSDLFRTPNYYSDVHIRDLGFNGSRLGDATLSSHWDPDKKGIAVAANVLYVGLSETSKPVTVDGFIYPEEKKNNFDLKVSVTNFQLKSIGRYMDDVVNILSGTASGNFTLTGPFNDPQISGSARAMRTAFTVLYLNTTYAFAHEDIRFDKNSISFENLVLLDQPYRDSALCNGKITHKKFSDWGFDVHIYPKNLLCLNTSASQNELFYGKGFVTGYAHIYGDIRKVKMDLDLKTERNSQLFIPMEYTSEVSENNYISFISQKDSSVGSREKEVYTGVELSCKFQVTDDAEVQILFDPLVGDRIRGRGNGNLTMEITTEGKFSMIGDYVVKSGDYLFTFENVLNKRFIIEEGGTINWSGDPYDALLDLKAIYKLKASASSLGFENTTGSIPVNCIINMSGHLINPTFSFDIDLPNLNEFDKSRYMSVIEQNMNYNFLTLLVVNSFYNPGVALGGNNSQTAGNIGLLGKTSSEVLSNQMSNWLSQISKDVDIGINYRPGDQITQQEVELALSTQLFNDRVRIQSNVGVGGGLANSQTENSSNIVGDVDVEVKLSKDSRLHVFNKSNQQDYFIEEAPYTQGVGIFYRKEFDTFKDLFKRKKGKNSRKQKGNEQEINKTE